MTASIWNPGSTAYAATGNGTVTERYTLTSGQTLINFATFTYTSGANALKVFVNGLYLTVGVDYLETSTSSITLTTAAIAGDEIECVGIVNLVDLKQSTLGNAEVDIAVATTTDIGGASTNFVRVVGAGTINSLGTNFNGPIFLRFTASVTLTNGAALICPGSTNLVVGAGYTCVATPKATNGLEDGWVISDLNARNFTQSGTGAVARTVQDELREMVNANSFTGVDPTGVADSYAGLVLAIAATPTGGTLRLNGFYRVSAALTINRSMTILGIDSRTGNLTSGANSKSYVYFNNDTNGFVVDGCVVTFDKVVIGSLVGTSTHYGISTVNVNNSLIVNNSVIQGFGHGVHLTAGYYNKFTNSTITYCDYGLVADACYNIVAEALSTNLNTTSNGINIELLNSSSMTMLGGSMENFGGTGFGAALYSGSSLTCIGTYIEGDTARANGWNFNLSTGASLSLIGLHVYLTGCARHVSIEGGGATGTRLFSRNTRFVYPTGAQACDVYALLNTDSTADWDISGDYWNTSAGVNVKYLAVGSTTVTNGTGNFRIQYPANHANYGKNLLSIPFAGGVPFPSTTNLSTDVNTLDDYKEGSWTPNVQGLTTGGAGTGTYTGKFTKIGNIVTVTGYISQSAHTGTGAMAIAGLPYAANNYSAITIGYVNGLTLTAGNIANGYISNGGNYINLTQTPTGGGAVSTVPIDTVFDMMFSCTYLV